MSPLLPFILLAHGALAGSFVEKYFAVFEFSADGRYFVGASVAHPSTEGGSIKVWDLDSQALVFEQDTRVVDAIVAPERPKLLLVTPAQTHPPYKDRGSIQISLPGGHSVDRRFDGFIGYGSGDTEYTHSSGSEPGTMLLTDGEHSVELPDFGRASWSHATGAFWYARSKHIVRASPQTGEVVEVYKHRKLGDRTMGADGRLMILGEAHQVLDLVGGEARGLPEDLASSDLILPGSTSVMVIRDHGERLVIHDAADMSVLRELKLDAPVSCRCMEAAWGVTYFPCTWHEGLGLLASHASADGVRLTDTTTGETVGHLDAGVHVEVVLARQAAQQEEETRAYTEERQALREAVRAQEELLANPHTRPTRQLEVEVAIDAGGCASLGIAVPLEWSEQQAMDAIVARLTYEHGRTWSTVTVVPPERRFINDCDHTWPDLDLRRDPGDDD
jgi:hypothetical protein